VVALGTAVVVAALSRLTDTQWRDAFRAGGYNAEHTSRYVAKIKAKVARGCR
jgi:hypothetical protein